MQNVQHFMFQPFMFLRNSFLLNILKVCDYFFLKQFSQLFLQFAYCAVAMC